MHVLYAMAEPGQVYKVQLAMAQLGAAFTTKWIDAIAPAQNRQGLGRSDLGPAGLHLVMEDGTQLSDPDAILFALAGGSSFAPRSAVEAAQVIEWMIFERQILCPAILRALAAALEAKIDPAGEAVDAEAADNQMAPALMRIDAHLSGQRFLLGGRYTIADIALYGSLYLAERAEIDLAPRPQIIRWIGDVRRTPGFVDVTDLLVAA